MKVVLDAHAADFPVVLQDIRIDVLTQLRRLEKRFNNKATEINLDMVNIKKGEKSSNVE